MLRSKGQYSFEVVLLTVLILYIAGITISAYFDVGDSVEAISMLKPRVYSVLAKSDSTHYIERVAFSQPAEDRIKLDVYLKPWEVPLEPELVEEIEDFSDDIAGKVSYDYVYVDVVYPDNGTANQPPIANAGGPYFPGNKKEIDISGGSSYDPDGSINTYTWQTNSSNCTISPLDAADAVLCCQGQVGQEQSISLTVTDNGGASDTSTVSVQLEPGNPPYQC